MQFQSIRGLAMLCAALLLSLLSVVASAAEKLTNADVEAWLGATEQLMPMQDAFTKMAKNETIANQYTEEEFKALAPAKQDEVMDEMLKQEGVYDQIYPVLKQFDWESAGEYMRVSSRIGLAIGAYMREQLLASVPEDQRERMEQVAKPVDANPEDVAVVKENWEQVSQFMNKHMRPPQ
ncbi:hypothetical protein KO507_14665 [Gilvimarinus agarilyticus]|uniref:hypothetical protein n=1 Tax=Gilvimarinus sp. 2_MG-2023 TaxID=3062666 RepID=UPI001C081BD2|nr:hypothetical protein [Gilvimarinus sp. 2_MG-2023]MBU2887010.1 hypothetical protein [Gilvimarinus agarilyticus]MDO6571670.1 hypothetical protein [Gilvimarinus sp. 2_MG-2023]